VENIRDDVTDEQLAAAFAVCGRITSAVVHREANGKSSRHGFVNFELPESAVKCNRQFKISEYLPTPGDRIQVIQHTYCCLVQKIRDDVTDEQLAAAFAVCGRITSAVVHREANGKSRRRGFVYFELPESAVKGVEQFNNSETLSTPGDRIQVMLHTKCCLVENIRDDVTDEQLAAAFAVCGKITSAVVHREANGNRHGFVNFELPESAVKCVKLNGSMTLSKPGNRIQVTHIQHANCCLVENIRDDVTDERLFAAFAVCGKITSAVVHRDANGKSSRRGFVNFELPESAVKGIELFKFSETLSTPGDMIRLMQLFIFDVFDDTFQAQAAESSSDADVSIDSQAYDAFLLSDGFSGELSRTKRDWLRRMRLEIVKAEQKYKCDVEFVKAHESNGGDPRDRKYGQTKYSVGESEKERPTMAIDTEEGHVSLFHNT
jgi:RNA recognition motif-containing protein